MGLMAWVTGKIGGPERYGAVRGRHATEHGYSLGETIFLTTGVGPSMGAAQIFGTSAQMSAAGFVPCFPGVSPPGPDSLTIYQRLLCLNLVSAMITFALLAHSNVAANLMRPGNACKYLEGVQASLLVSSVERGLFANIRAAHREVSSYINTVSSDATVKLLDFRRPGSGDLLELFILRAVAETTAKSQYGFVQSGPSGFDLKAVSLLRGIKQSVAETADLYKW